MNISIIGFGYIGAVIGAVLCDNGHTVNAIDNNKECIDDLNKGKCSVPEPLLQIMIKKAVASGFLSGTTSYNSITESDVILITVGTPLSKNFDADLSAIKDVFNNLANNVRDEQILMLKSTVPPGVTRKLANEYFGEKKNVYIGFSPERLAEGNAINELKTLPIIVGGINSESTKKCSEFWKKALNVEVIEVSSCESAELVKLANNQWIDLNIALANELAILCDALPYDLDILEIIQGANSLKKGQHFVNILTPSIGVGGYCLTKDPWFLSALGDKHGASINLPRAGRNANDKMPQYSVDSIVGYFKDQKKELTSIKISILGYSFKSNSGDVRFSPMKSFIDGLQKNGINNIDVYDSTISKSDITNKNINKLSTWQECIKGADCIVFGASHDDISSISIEEISEFLEPKSLVFDGRRYFNENEIDFLRKLKIKYIGIGRSFS